MSYHSQGEQIEEGEDVSERGESSEFITVKGAGRKELCEVCEAALKKYTCPRCQVRSCGISCLNKHKKIRECSGIADQFSTIEGKKIEEKDVEKDYIFVKQMLSNADKVKKTLTGVDNLGQQPKRFKIMRINAKKIYNVTLLNAPPIIERHRQNISFFFVKTKTFYWVVELLFWREEKGKQKYDRMITPPTPDDKNIEDIIPNDFLSRDLLQLGINTQKKEEFSVYLERKDRNAVGTLPILANKNLPLRDALVNQLVYEFPSLVIVHQTLIPSYLSYRRKPQQIKTEKVE